MALAFRLLFGLLIARTFDYDEFVILLLSRDFAHGAVPYRDFAFFHPPGVLILYRALEPLTGMWWPAARIAVMLADTATAGLVWLLGRHLYGDRAGVTAGILYAVSPLALVSAVRVDQDTLFTLLGMAGLALVVLRRDRASALLAGILLAFAIWLKLPAALFLPVYLLAAPRRAPLWFASLVVTGALLSLAVLPQWHQFYFDIVTFQKTRWLMALPQRAGTVALYGVAVNLLAFPGLLGRIPWWVRAGLLVGAVFVFSSQIYYHYFVPMAPFAALLAAPLAARVAGNLRLILSLGALLATSFGLWIDRGGPSPLYITAAHLSALQPTVQLLDRTTPRNGPVLADQYEYAYLAHRPAALHYFWNIGVLVDAHQLEAHLPGTRAVVLSYGASSGYPAGFVAYLDRHFPTRRTNATTVWFLPPTR